MLDAVLQALQAQQQNPIMGQPMTPMTGYTPEEEAMAKEHGFESAEAMKLFLQQRSRKRESTTGEDKTQQPKKEEPKPQPKPKQSPNFFQQLADIFARATGN